MNNSLHTMNALFRLSTGRYRIQLNIDVSRHLRPALLPVLLAAGCLFGACSDDDEGESAATDGGSVSDTPLVADGPEPATMCPTGEAPLVAAYEADSGRYRWVACSDQVAWVTVRAATDDRVFLFGAPSPERPILGFDAETGEQVWNGTEAEYQEQLPGDADVAFQEAPVVEGVRLTGGQDDPLVAVDATTDEQLWSQSRARLAYDDVWPVGDGAIFAVDSRDPMEGATPNPGNFTQGVQTHVAAYEIESGDIRWARHTGGYLWPWHVRGDRLYILWDNLEVVDTSDGRIIWSTDYAATESGFPRMTGAVANDELVFVSFTVVRSGGD